jgi:hypothetical protein
MGCVVEIANRWECQEKGVEKPSAASPRQHNYNWPAFCRSFVQPMLVLHLQQYRRMTIANRCRFKKTLLIQMMDLISV